MSFFFWPQQNNGQPRAVTTLENVAHILEYIHPAMDNGNSYFKSLLYDQDIPPKWSLFGDHEKMSVFNPTTISHSSLCAICRIVFFLPSWKFPLFERGHNFSQGHLIYFPVMFLHTNDASVKTSTNNTVGTWGATTIEGAAILLENYMNNCGQRLAFIYGRYIKFKTYLIYFKVFCSSQIKVYFCICFNLFVRAF